jgi:hypothetical protein
MQSVTAAAAGGVWTMVLDGGSAPLAGPAADVEALYVEALYVEAVFVHVDPQTPEGNR